MGMAAETSPPLVYIVDDEPVLLELAGAILNHHGYSFKVFTNPIFALESFASAKPRPVLLITDYAMNPMNGLELADEFRRLEPRQKVLLISGTAGEEILGEASHPPDAFLAKPYQAEKFMDFVRGLVASSNK